MILRVLRYYVVTDHISCLREVLFGKRFICHSFWEIRRTRWRTSRLGLQWGWNKTEISSAAIVLLPSSLSQTVKCCSSSTEWPLTTTRIQARNNFFNGRHPNISPSKKLDIFICPYINCLSSLWHLSFHRKQSKQTKLKKWNRTFRIINNMSGINLSIHTLINIYVYIYIYIYIYVCVCVCIYIYVYICI